MGISRPQIGETFPMREHRQRVGSRHSSCTELLHDGIRHDGMPVGEFLQGGTMMRKLVWLAAAFAVWGAGVADAQQQPTPRKGGTIRMTAPYAASFGSLDPHVTPRAQDDIVNKAVHRTLYNWDTANNKLVLELATAVSVSPDGLVYTYKLRDDAYFHNGRKMTADDIIWSYTRIMDGSKGYPGARYIRLIKGAVEVEKGSAKEISGRRK